MKKRSKSDSIRYLFHTAKKKGKALRRDVASLSTSQKGLPKASLTLNALMESAHELGIEVEELVDGAYEFKLGNATRRIKKGPIIDLENSFSYWLCGNKYATFEILKKYGFEHVPRYERYSLSTIDEARRDFLRRNCAVVIKPSSGTSGGKGVAVDIRNMKELNKAIFESLMYDSNFLMEDFIEGDHFRFLFFKDRMINVYQRIPARVKGDGVNNIRSLIRIENDRRARIKGPPYPIVVDNEVKQCLVNKNMSFSYIPKADEIVNVRTVVNQSTGGEANFFEESVVNEDIINDCRTVMRIMDVTLGGIDVITKSIERPLAGTGGVINEVNTSPGLYGYDKKVTRSILSLMFERN